MLDVIIIIIITLFISVEIFFIGKYISKTNKLFEDNEYGSFVVGAVTYFFVTFLTFFFFIWVKPSNVYFAVILLIKELFQITFLFLKRETFFGMKINWKHIILSIFSMITIPLIFNYGFYEIIPNKALSQTNDFQSWFIYKDAIEKFSQINEEIVSKWILSMIASITIFNIVASFVYRFSKRKNFIDGIISYLATIGLILLFGLGIRIEYIIGSFLILFAIQLSVNIIMKSRRRYAIMFGFTVIASWFFNPSLFLVNLVLSISTSLIYTFLKKPKASLFWVQLISPSIILSSLWLYTISNTGALFLVIITVISYLFMISAGRIELLEKMEKFIYKYLWAIILIIYLSIFVYSVVIMSTTENSIKNYFLYKNAIVDSFNNLTWEKIQSYLMYVIEFICLIITVWYIIKAKNITNKRIVVILSLTMFLLGYNFMIRAVIENTKIYDQFSPISISLFMPLILFVPLRFRKSKIKF
ncbi:MAG: hypothetical protein HRT99_00205 [Mycoplasmatales bacterium]|nr:hypothetical protein [Mycoplasmatales bacterium]